MAALSPGAREALGILRREGGRATVKSLALRFGELRRIGPAALERERPWEHPMPPLEELVYSGLAFAPLAPPQAAMASCSWRPVNSSNGCRRLGSLQWSMRLRPTCPTGWMTRGWRCPKICSPC